MLASGWQDLGRRLPTPHSTYRDERSTGRQSLLPLARSGAEAASRAAEESSYQQGILLESK